MVSSSRVDPSLREDGFTLIELLVVMIVIGILASIAIPVFLNQRAKARDTSTKADLSTVGKEIATYFVDGTGTLVLTVAPGTAALSDGSYTSGNILLSGGTAQQAGSAGWTVPATANTWCAGFTNPAGSAAKNWKISASGGLAAGSCP